ncbi:MAG TPA: glycosyltransferase [bacterium]|nr:glycosyltransferase [bacterium]HQP96946.1 glycosyltransferase [bacterium]
MESKSPCATIIIPVYRDAESVLRCLDAILHQETDRCLETIVVDDGSKDDTVSIIENWIADHATPDRIVRTLAQDHAGPAVARNRGAKEATGPILLFTDADCEPHADWVERMLAPFEDPAVQGVKGAYETRQTSWVARLVQVEYEEKYIRMAQFDSIDFIDTYSAGFRRDVFLSLGGFDEGFPTASVEDQEFSFRLAEHGYRMVFVPDARVVHRHAETLSHYIRKKFRIAYYKSYLLVRHPGRVKGDTHTPPTLIAQIPLTYGLLGFLVAIPFWSPSWWFCILFAAANLACMSGTLRLCRDRASDLTARVPLLLAARSLALGAGLISGTIRFRMGKTGAAPDRSTEES